MSIFGSTDLLQQKIELLESRMQKLELSQHITGGTPGLSTAKQAIAQNSTGGFVIMAENLRPQFDSVSGSFSVSGSTFGDLGSPATTGPQVTVQVGPTKKVLVQYGAGAVVTNNEEIVMSFQATGASTLAPGSTITGTAELQLFNVQSVSTASSAAGIEASIALIRLVDFGATGEHVLTCKYRNDLSTAVNTIDEAFILATPY